MEHSGSVLDSRPRGRGFEPHRRHCVVSLSKNINPGLVLVQPGKTSPFIAERLLMDVRNQIKQNKCLDLSEKLLTGRKIKSNITLPFSAKNNGLFFLRASVNDAWTRIRNVHCCYQTLGKQALMLC